MTSRSLPQPRHPRAVPTTRSTRRLSILLLIAGLLVAGCLPSALGPTPTPSPPPATPTPPPPTPPPTPVPPTPTPAPTFLIHVVAGGETLTSIARRYRTTARSIAFWNRTTYPTLDPTSPGYAPNRIQVGWQLQVLRGQRFDESTLVEGPDASPTPMPSLDIPAAVQPPLGESIVVSAGPRGGNGVALTIQLGGRTAPDDAVIAWLVDNRVPATVFATGEAAATEAGVRALALVAANPDLLTVGNLTWDHRSLVGLTTSQVRAQLERAEAAVGAAVGTTTMPFMRPPFGSHDRSVRDVVGRAGYAYVVLWDIDTSDWQGTAAGGPTPEDVVSRVVSRAEGGSIVLLHAGGESTLSALPGIVDGLAAEGLLPVTLDVLFGVDRRG